MAQESSGAVASEFKSELASATPASGARLTGTGPPELRNGIRPNLPISVWEGTKHDGRKLYRWSVATVVAANAVDVASSWRHPEANPFLAQPGSRFGLSSVALKAGFAGASLVIERFALRSNPKLYKKLAWLNFAIAGGLGFTARHNFSVH